MKHFPKTMISLAMAIFVLSSCGTTNGSTNGESTPSTASSVVPSTSSDSESSTTTSTGGDSSSVEPTTVDPSTTETTNTETTTTESSVDPSTESSSIEPVVNKYNIRILNNELAAITLVGDNKRAENDAVTFVVSPIRDSIIIDAVYVRSAEHDIPTSNSGNSYTFLMPNEDVEISVAVHEDVVESTYQVRVLSNDLVDIAIANGISEAKPGSMVQFTVNPKNEDIAIDAVEVLGVNGESISVTLASNAYSFIMPEFDVYISVEATITTEYSVTANCSDNVRFNLIRKDESNLYKPGEEVMFSLLVDYGYKVNKVTIKTASGTNVTFTQNSCYTFIMPNDNVVIDVTTAKLYEVVIENSEHTLVTINNRKDYYDSNETITFTAEVTNNNYVIDTVSAKVGSRELELTTNGNTYSFVMPKGKVTIRVTEKEAENPESNVDPFTSKTTYEGMWTYFDGYRYDYEMHFRVVFNGDKTLNWYLSYVDVTDDDWDDYGDYYEVSSTSVIGPSIKRTKSRSIPSDMTGEYRDDDCNVEYTYDEENDQIVFETKYGQTPISSVIQLTRNGDNVVSCYMTNNLSSDFGQTKNRTLYLK